MAHSPESHSNRLPWTIALICVPLILLLIEVVRGAVNETRSVRDQTLQTQLQSLSAVAKVRAKGLETVVGRFLTEGRTLQDALAQPGVADYWSKITLPASNHLYAALVDREGTIVLHTDPSKVGARLQRGWYERRLPEFAPDLVLTRQSALDAEHAAYDMAVPVDLASDAAEYHEALDAEWLDGQTATRQRSTLWRWAIVLGLVVAVDVAAAGSLASLARFHHSLSSSFKSQSEARSKELSQIGSGLAHEVRNPLHALRINLHTLRRAMGGRSPLPPDQLVATIEESDGAIDRLDVLMRDLLQYSDPTAGKRSQIDLAQEVQATLRLLAEEFRRDQITIEQQLPAEPLQIAMDPHRLRQSLLNLITFAQHRAGKAGTIEVQLARDNGGAELSVSNSGPALGEKQRLQLFEPFQAPAETGSGLGLALVQTFVEEVGGRATCDSDGPTKGLCRIWFPLDESVEQGVS